MENETKPKRERQPQAAKAAPEVVAFDTWFTVKVSQRRKVRAHHYETLKAYFKKQGLSENEPNDKFEAALKSFGY